MKNAIFEINQPTRCNSFTSLLLDVLCRSTCFGRLHAYHQELTTALTASGFTVGALVIPALLVVFWPDHDQQHCYHHAPTVKPEAVNTVVSSWWWAWRLPKHVERQKTSSNKLVKLLHLVGWFIWIVWLCADLRTSNARFLCLCSLSSHSIPRNEWKLLINQCYAVYWFWLIPESNQSAFVYWTWMEFNP